MPKPPSITIGEEGTAFFYQIGQAISQWSFVEDGLFRIAANGFGARDWAVLAAGYASIENFRSKLGFADSMFRASRRFVEFETDWEVTHSFIAAQSKSRNFLAHSRVIVFLEADEGRRYAVVPGRPTVGKKKAGSRNPPAGSLCLREIDHCSKQFTRASLMLASIDLRLRGEPDHFRESLNRQLFHRSLDQIAKELRLKIGAEPEKRARGK